MSKRITHAALALGFGLAVGYASAQAPQGTVKVGVLTDMGGTYADVAGKGSVLAAQMAVEDHGGKALGNPVALLSADHQQKTDVASTIARTWYERDGVDAIFDLPNSGIALAVQNIAKDADRISVISSGATDAATNKQCSPTGMHWTFDSYSSAKVLSLAAAPGSSWYFLTQDTVGGSSLQQSLEPFIKAAGSKVTGAVRYPLGSTDMSSFLLQAQGSRARYIAMAAAGTDTINTVKQASEFGLGKDGKQTLMGIVVFLTDLKAMGLDNAQGLTYPTGFFPGQSPEAMAWSKRFQARHNGVMPNDSQAGVYSSVLHYLKAVDAAGTKDAKAVAAKMRELPVNDVFAKNGKVREDGRMVHDMFLVQAKKPGEAADPWDLLKLVKTVPGEEAFRPLSESECPLVKK